MWVLACGMIRSGSTLQYQIAAELVERHGIGQRIEYASEEDFPILAARYRGVPGHKVFKAHICTPELEQLCSEGDAVALYSYRDLRDVALSASRKFGISLEDLLERGWLDQAIADGKRWRAQPRVLVSRYEEVVMNLTLEVERTAQFLELQTTRSQAEQIAVSLSIDQQRERIRVAMPEAARAARATLLEFDPHSLLHHNHIHEGEVGGWRTLSPDEQLRLAERYGWWLTAEGYLK
jgi:hypothetical protein